MLCYTSVHVTSVSAAERCTTGRNRDNFRALFNLCDKVDNESAALMPLHRQPGCMAYSRMYREELTKLKGAASENYSQLLVLEEM